MCLQPKTWNLIGNPPYRSLTFIQKCSFQWKNFFFDVANSGAKPPFFGISLLKLQKVVLDKLKGKLIAVGYLLKKTLLGLPHIVKAASEEWQKPRVKVNSIITRFFQHEPCWEMDVMSDVNFALSSKKKCQLRDLYNYLN